MTGPIGKTFRSFFERRRKQATANAKAMIGMAPVQAEVDSDDAIRIEPSNLEKLKVQYDRTDLRQNYRKTIESPKETTLNLAMANKTQSDLLSQAQRDYVMQESSRVRLTLHAAARRAALGSDDGPIAKGIVGDVERMLKG